ncbi:SWIM zinc finger family protein [Aquipuribacter hungaricus]|uniref:SWIM zinc finger family protein n=1 Tax=Aquipuribacter hungaricus TaxID=545624 RepID=A0ABV7WFR1_9MICO
MVTRWDESRVLALAPDASASAAGQGLARVDASWEGTGASTTGVGVTGGTGGVLWGRCAGSGSSAYRVAVDLTGPASRCTCPSRKFPCKHALGLLLRWSRGSVPEAAEVPDDVAGWVASRQARAAASLSAGGPAARVPADPEAAAGRAARREQRVATGLDELERWLHDQLRTGLAAARADGPAESARVAARLVDAQASGAAALVRDLPWGAGDDRWPDRVLAGMARLALLVTAWRTVAGGVAAGRVAAEVVRSRVGWSTSTGDVLATPGIPDRWLVAWQVDEADGRLLTRRAHVHGTTTGHDLYVLAWGVGGQPPDTGLLPGQVLDADLHVHPGRPLRAVVGERRGASTENDGDRARGVTVARATATLAAALARDPWVRAVPVVLSGVRPARGPAGWTAVDADGAGLPLLGADAPLGWLAASGGHPSTVAGELSPAGLRLRAVLDTEQVRP